MAIVGVLFLAAVLLEHFGWLSSVARGVIFWGGMAAVAAVVAWYIVRPLVKMAGLGKRLSHAEAARIVGRHFPEVGDKLLNLLQLMEEEEKGKVKAESGKRKDEGDQSSPLSTPHSPLPTLLLAAIEQKTEQLRPVPFANAVDLKANRRYLKYALPPLALIVLLLVVAPQVVTEPSKRIVNYSTVYERPAPFRFTIENASLTVWPGHDYTLSVSVDGEALPAEAFINIEGRRYKMTRLSPTLFEYTFRQVARSQQFALEASGVTDGGHLLRMLPDPQVVEFRMLLSYPAYTGRQAETVVNLGDAAVPEGTHVKWIFQTKDADSVHFALGSALRALPTDANGRAEIATRVMQTLDYGFAVSNNEAVASDTLRYSLSAIADALPLIAVEEIIDSLHPDRRIFRGRVKDDYGFSRLVFVHQTTNTADTARKTRSEA